MSTEYEIKQLMAELPKVKDPIVQKILERILEILNSISYTTSSLDA